MAPLLSLTHKYLSPAYCNTKYSFIMAKLLITVKLILYAALVHGATCTCIHVLKLNVCLHEVHVLDVVCIVDWMVDQCYTVRCRVTPTGW